MENNSSKNNDLNNNPQNEENLSSKKKNSPQSNPNKIPDPKSKNINNKINILDKSNLEMSNPLKIFSKKPTSESKFLSESILKLKNGDDMDIMSQLIILCEKLSLSSDQIADDPNMSFLLEEICKNLEKAYLPELILYTLQCINYILDLNPAFTSTLKRVGAIPKIIILISVIEDMTCIELIIKILEKISYENSYSLLENNAFISLLNLIDFLSENQRKSVMKTCLNMSINISSYKSFNNYILQAMNILSDLTKYNENDVVTTNTAILIYYNIIVNIKKNNMIISNPEIEKEIYNYKFLENFCEIVKSYLISHNNSEKKINIDIIKRILKIFEIISNLSKKGLEKLFNIKILELINEIIIDEFDLKNKNSDINKNTISFLSEIFPLITSFFPDKKEKINKEKILSEENKENYNYFCSNILSILIDNIMSKSACSTLSNLIKFLIIFIKSADKNIIIKNIHSKSLAQIISKLLDTKYLPYLNDLIILMSELLSKCPEHFIVNFIREGIVENLKNFKFEKNENKSEKKKDDKNLKIEKKVEIKIDKKDDEKNEKNENENENDDKKEDKSLLNKIIGFNKVNFEKNPNPILFLNEKINISDEENSINEESENNNNNKNKNTNEMNNNLNDLNIIDNNKINFENPFKNGIKFFSNKYKDDQKFKDILKEFEKKEFNKIFNKNDFYFEDEENYFDTEIQKIELEKKLNEFKEKFLNEEKIKLFLSENNKNNELINLKEKLLNLKEDLNKEINLNNFEENFSNEIHNENLNNILIKIIEILSNPANELTLFEIENSKIFLILCEFFDKIFIEFYNKLIEDENSTQKILPNDFFKQPLKQNLNIFQKTKFFINLFNNDKNKIKNFINLLEYTITSMNCFVMIIDDGSTNDLDLLYHQTMKNIKKIEIKVVYSEEMYNKLLDDPNITDPQFKEKLNEYHQSFLASKDIRILTTNHSTFDDITSILLSNTNVKFQSNEKYDVNIVYFYEHFDKKENKKEEFYLKNEWTNKEVKKQIASKFNIKDIDIFRIVCVKFGLSYKIKEKKDNNKENNNNNNKSNEKKNLMIFDYKKFFEENNNLNENLIIDYKNINIDKIIFEKIYHLNILYSKNFYEIKRLMPSLYLLSLMFYSLSYFKNLFNIPENLFNEEEIQNLFINSKVTLLISKASKDGFSVSRKAIPSWCKNINLDFNFLTKFENRFLLFKVTFEPKRSLINLQNYLKSYSNYNPNERQISLEKSMRMKYIVEREKILEHGFKILKDPILSNFSGFLEFEYTNEIGNGLGPTLEFFSLLFDIFKNNSKLWYKTTDKSFYPNFIGNDNKEICDIFKLMGFMLARALYDDRLFDFQFSSVFWDLILDRPITIDSIKKIDKDLGKTMNDLNELIIKKKEFIANNKENVNLNEKILINNMKLNELDIYFVFPGYNFPLKENGENILLDMYNIEEYVYLIYDKLFVSGVDNIVKNFKEGFNKTFNLNYIKLFKSNELENLICSSLEKKWEENEIFDNIKAEHGITKKSEILKYLIKFMTNLNKEEQKKFLLFTTGTSRLPVGGFKNLNPKFTVVKRSTEKGENPDNYLPTVMTCQNYLKIPEYSSYEVLRDKLTYAMNEGNNEFHLS